MMKAAIFAGEFVGYCLLSDAISMSFNSAWANTVEPAGKYIPGNDYIPKIFKRMAKGITKRSVKQYIFKTAIPLTASITTSQVQIASPAKLTTITAVMVSSTPVMPVITGVTCILASIGICIAAYATYKVLKNRKVKTLEREKLNKNTKEQADKSAFIPDNNNHSLSKHESKETEKVLKQKDHAQNSLLPGVQPEHMYS